MDLGHALDRAIAGELRSAVDRARAKALLREPWFDPPTGTERGAAARALQPAGPRPVRPGETLLVSCSDDQRRAALSVLRPAAEDAASGAPLRGEALRAWDEAEALARQLVPLVHPAALRTSWTRRPSARVLVGEASALEGASFGLALTLAAASALTATPLPADLVALAALRGRALVGVGGLEVKLRLLQHTALSVRRVVVAPSDAADARRIVGDALQVIAAPDVVEAARHALPFAEVEGTLAALAREPGVVERWTERLFLAALADDPGLWSWRAFEASCRFVERTRAEPRLTFAARVASRHQGGTALVEVGDAWLAGLPRPHRLRVWAHAVQSRTDSEDPSPDTFAGVARSMVPPALDRHPEDLVLLGAIGRAFAAGRRYHEAATALDEAISGWLLLGELCAASYALAERLRVAAVQRDASALDALEGGALARFLEEAEEPGRGHVEVARAVAATALGRPVAALEEALVRAPIGLRPAWLRLALRVRRGDPSLLAELDDLASRAPRARLHALVARLEAGAPGALEDLRRGAEAERAAWGWAFTRLEAQLRAAGEPVEAGVIRELRW